MNAYRDLFSFHHVGTVAPQRFYPAGVMTAATLTVGTPSVDILRLLPFVCNRSDAEIDRLAIEVTTLASGGTARLGIYDSVDEESGDLYPNELILDAGQVLTSTTGVKSISISQKLIPGKLYWLAHLAGANAATIRCANKSQLWPILGLDGSIGTSPGVGWYAAQAYGALPATFPLSGAVLDTAPFPAIFARFAS